MPFHRLTTPSYFVASGNLLAGYDYINNPGVDGTAGAGAAASVSAQQTVGPNDGSYFNTFAEDASSANMNRPHSALAQNTDFLDDILNNSIPVISTQDATASGAVATIALTGDVFVGVSGSANTAAQRERLVHITDQNNNDLEVGGVKVTVSLIHDGAAANVVGTEADGFHTDPSVNVSPSIPDGTAYRVHFGLRSSYSTVSLTTKGALFENALRTVHNVAGEIRALFRQIHADNSPSPQDWDDPFDSNIRSLASAGLNERYRRATTEPAGFSDSDYDVAGSGAVITRDGPAVEISAPDTVLTFGTVWADPQQARLRFSHAGTVSGGVAHATNRGGDVGIYHETPMRTASGNLEAVSPKRMGPLILDAWQRVAFADNASFCTFIHQNANASLNPDAGTGATDRRTIEAAAGQYFRKAGVSACRRNVDLIEVEFTSGTPRTETYVIDDVVSDTRVSVKTMWGENPDFGSGVTTADVRLRLLQVGSSIGGMSLDDGNVRRTFLVTRPTGITTDPIGNGENLHDPPMFAASIDEGPDAGGLFAVAMAWGNMVGDSVPEQAGFLYGNGAIRCQSLSVNGITGVDNTINNGSGETITYTLPLRPLYYDLAGWIFDASSTGWVTTSTSARFLVFPLHVQEGDSIESITVRVDGNGSAGSLPGTMPEVVLMRNDPDTGPTVLKNVFDTTASVPAYHLPHNITMTTGGALPHVAVAGSWYMIVVVSPESGAIAGDLSVRRIQVEITRRASFNVSVI